MSDGTTSELSAKVKRRVFTVTTNSDGNVEINILPQRTLCCTVLGSPYFLQIRKNANNEYMVINVKDKQFNNVINTTIAILVTYLDY